jgi:hypothetical protein
MNNEQRKRLKAIFTMGGKGGTGKTTVITALAEFFKEYGIPCVRLDLDTENKVKGSFCHFFPEDTQKIDINTRAGLDAFIDLADEASIILADMGSGSGKVAHGWFDSMYESISDTMSFTALGLVTSDPASVESVLAWAARLQNRVSYVIVLNKQEDDASAFTYWEQTAEAVKFRKLFKPEIIQMDSRLPDLQHAMRNHGATLTSVIKRDVAIPELTKSSLVMRAQAYRKQLFAEFDRIKGVLLP